MKVSTEKIPESQVLMTIEVEQERLDKAREKAVRKLAPKARVPGFRPGKAPPDMIRRYFGEDRVLDEALDDLVPVIYREAVEADESIDPIARPRLVIETTEPLVVKATIPVRPTIELNDYASVRVELEDVVVDEARVEETLLTLRRRAATVEPADRPVAWRDVVRIDVRATVDDETLVEPQETEIQLVEGQTVIFPGFEEALRGAAKGEERTFELDVPETVRVEKFAGKKAQFTVKVLEVKEEVLPELDDEFVAQVGEGFGSVDVLRDRIRDDIRRYEEDQLHTRWHEEIAGKLVDIATIEYPPIMVESEIDRLVHDQLGHVERGEDLQRYLQSVGKTEEQLREELRPIAETRLKRGLVLGRVAEAEGIDVTPDEIDAEVDVLSGSNGPQQRDRLRQLFGSEGGRDTIRRNLLTRKTLDRLIEMATEGAVKPGELREAQRALVAARAAEAADAAGAPAGIPIAGPEADTSLEDAAEADDAGDAAVPEASLDAAAPGAAEAAEEQE